MINKYSITLRIISEYVDNFGAQLRGVKRHDINYYINYPL